MNAADIVFVTSNYKVIAVRKSDGVRIWETTLVTSFFKPMQPFVTMIVDETGLYVHTNQELLRLDLQTGAILWRTEISARRWGSQEVASIATLGVSNGPPSAAARAALDRFNSGPGSGPS